MSKLRIDLRNGSSTLENPTFNTLDYTHMSKDRFREGVYIEVPFRETFITWVSDPNENF